MSTLQTAGMQVAATSCLLWIRVRGIKITFSKSSKNLEKTGSKVHQPEVQAGTVIHNLWVIGWGDLEDFAWWYPLHLDRTMLSGPIANDCVQYQLQSACIFQSDLIRGFFGPSGLDCTLLVPNEPVLGSPPECSEVLWLIKPHSVLYIALQNSHGQVCLADVPLLLESTNIH